MKFKLHLMEKFCAVMSAGSISGAARILHTSQSGLSKTISDLEESLGLKLFTRTQSSLIPTKAATILFDQVAKVVLSAEEIDGLVDDLRAFERGGLTFASTPSFALTLVPSAIHNFKKQYPDTHIVFRTLTVPEISQSIIGGKCEFAISALPVENASLACEQIFESDVVCIMPKDHPLANSESVDLRRVADYSMILYEKESLFGTLTRQAFSALGIEPSSTVDVIRTEQACALVQAGLGISFVSEFAAGAQVWAGTVTRPLVQRIVLPGTLIHSAFVPLSVQARAFVECVKGICTQH